MADPDTGLDLSLDRLIQEADAFAELWPEHVGEVDHHTAMIFGIPSLRLSGMQVSRQIDARLTGKEHTHVR